MPQTRYDRLLDSHGVDSYWPFKRTFRTILLAYLPASFHDCLRTTVHSTFHRYRDEATRVKLAEDLDNMGILTDFKTHISGVMEEEIKSFIIVTCPRIRDRHMLPELRTWFNENVKSWLTDIYGKGIVQQSDCLKISLLTRH